MLSTTPRNGPTSSISSMWRRMRSPSLRKKNARTGTITTKIRLLAARLPDMMAKLEQPSDIAPEGLNSLKAQVVARLRADWDQRSGDIMRQLPAAGLQFLSVASNLIFVVIVPVLAFFFLKDGDLIRRHMLEMLD